MFSEKILTKQKIWRKNFEIRRTALHVISPLMHDAVSFQHQTVSRMILKEIVCIFKDYDQIGSYVPVDQLRSLIKATMSVIQEKPDLIEHIHKKTEQYNTAHFNYAKKILRMSLPKMPNVELIKIYKKLNWHQEISHGYALPTTWWVDSDGEDLSKFLIKKVGDLVKAKKSKLSVPEVFSILTTPIKSSMALKEEIESLELLKSIEADKQAKSIFLQKDIGKIEKDLDKINPWLKRKISGHYRKWHWVPYTYIGPAYDLDFYLTGWSGLLRQKINIEKHLNKLKSQIKRTGEEKEKIIKTLGVDKKTKQLFDIASEIIYLKAYRKDCLFFGFYVLEKIHTEIAKRLNLSLKQVRFIVNWEMPAALRRGYFPEQVLNERIKFCVYYQKGARGFVYTGQKAKQFLSKIKMEKEKIKKVDKLEGTCACPGKVRGEVKVINVPEEMVKMREGNIMVAHTTFPALVPAMKKAAAIVTDDGGITCHAAIVARELKTPCVVGTKIATRILKDGDLVEVDATKGVVKIIK